MNTTPKQREIIKNKIGDLSRKYIIKPYTITKANALGVVVKPSSRKNKKIDVYDKNNNYLVSVGAKGYSDYPTYLELEKLGVYRSGHAKKRRILYRKRHNRDRSIIGSAGYYADKLLW